MVAATDMPGPLREVGYDQRLGQQIPMDLPFRDESGKSVRLGDLFGKRPVVLVLAYYECPMLCDLVLQGVVTTLKPLTFNAAMLAEDGREALGKEDRELYPRLLAVDNEVVVPVNTTIRVLVTASDVLHAFAMPAFGIKVDAVPGRINETWFLAEKEGLYYGQCSELCGKDHAFMPIAIRVVSQQQYDTWVQAAKTDIGAANRALMAEVEGTNKVAVAAE